MNRYPRWIYVTIAVALALGLLYTLPNFFGEAPAVQVSTARTTLKIDSTVLGRVEDALVLHRARFRIDGDHRLRLREADVDGAVAPDGDGAGIAGDAPSAHDFLIARRNRRELGLGKRLGGSEQYETDCGEITPRSCRRSFQ